MNIYDTLSNSVKEVNLKNKEVKIYACGPTVYDFLHIGNARPLVLTDLIVRCLRYKGINTNLLINITDIDDKIISKAIKTSSNEKEISEKYTNHFLDDYSSLNLIKPNKFIPISDKIPEIIEYINKLIIKGHAYEKNGNVFFRINNFKNTYGNLSKQDINKLISQEDNLIEKDNILDFSLWKKTGIGIKWDSPWGQGRPGWHTECSVLNEFYFNETIDIHVGGIDLKFPHHENERIQCIAQNNYELSSIWMHNGHLNFDGDKMSKSIGNMILIKDFVKNNGANSLKYLFYTSDYKQPINITDDLIENSNKWNLKIHTLLKKLNWMSRLKGSAIKNEKSDTLERFNKNIENNLNIPMCITLIDILVKKINTELKDKIISNSVYELETILETLGFIYEIKEINKNLILKILEWEENYNNKNFKKSDEIRLELIKEGIF